METLLPDAERKKSSPTPPRWSLASSSRSSVFELSFEALKRRVYLAIFGLVAVAAAVGATLGSSLSGIDWVETIFGYGLTGFATILLFLTATRRISIKTLDGIVVTAAVILVPLRTVAFIIEIVPNGTLAQILAETSSWYATVFILVFVMLDRRKALFWSLLLYLELLVLGVTYLVHNSADIDPPTINLAFQSFVLANATYIALLLILTRTKEEYARSAHQRTQLATLAATDELTGIPNRRRFLSVCDQFVRDAQDTNEELTVIMLDIDHFKAVNDTHGHAMGDLVLKRVTALVAANARDSDVYGRIGGEEFAVLVTGSGMDVARVVAERLRSAIEADQSSDTPRVTASLGVAEWEEGDTTNSLMERADRALYAAKTAGRNQVSVMYGSRLPGSETDKR